MKKVTKIAIAAALSLGLVGGATAYGKHRFGSHEARIDHMVERVSDRLDLDSSQEQLLSTLADELSATHERLHSGMAPAKTEMLDLLSAESFNQTRAVELIQAKTAEINASAPMVIGALGNFLDSLNVEQKAQVQQFMEKKGKRGKHGRHSHDEG